MYVKALLTLINSMICVAVDGSDQDFGGPVRRTLSFGLFKEQQWPADSARASEGTHIPGLTNTVLRISALDGKDVNHIVA